MWTELGCVSAGAHTFVWETLPMQDTSWMWERRDQRLTPVTWLLRRREGIFVQIRGYNIFDLALFSLINNFYILKT